MMSLIAVIVIISAWLIQRVINMNISLTPELENYLKQKVQTGITTQAVK